MNAIYGAIVNKYFRWFDPDMGEAITLSGQLSIKYAEHRLNKFLNDRYGLNIDWVVAGDTDSLYLTLDKVLEYHNVDEESRVDFMDHFGENVLSPEIERLYDDLAKHMNAYAQKMFMKREIIASSAIWTTKKRYAMLVDDAEGVRFEKPKIKIKGLEPIRSSTPSACRPKIMDAIGIMLSGNEKELWEFVEKFREEFEELGFEEIANATTVNNLSKYTMEGGKWAKKTPFHVRGAIVFNHLRKVLGLENVVDEIRDGDKAYFSMLKMPNPADSDVITGPYLPKEFGLEEYLDHEAQFQKNFIKPIETMAHSIGWKVENKGDISEWF